MDSHFSCVDLERLPSSGEFLIAISSIKSELLILRTVRNQSQPDSLQGRSAKEWSIGFRPFMLLELVG
jgi:predicted nucleic acid binding AN1-type Zn finger protein